MHRYDSHGRTDLLWFALQFIVLASIGLILAVLIFDQLQEADREHEREWREWHATHVRVGGVAIFTEPGTGCRFIVNESRGLVINESYTQVLRPDGKPDCGQGGE